ARPQRSAWSAWSRRSPRARPTSGCESRWLRTRGLAAPSEGSTGDLARGRGRQVERLRVVEPDADAHAQDVVVAPEADRAGLALGLHLEAGEHDPVARGALGVAHHLTARSGDDLREF